MKQRRARFLPIDATFDTKFEVQFRKSHPIFEVPFRSKRKQSIKYNKNTNAIRPHNR